MPTLNRNWEFYNVTDKEYGAYSEEKEKEKKEKKEKDDKESEELAEMLKEEWLKSSKCYQEFLAKEKEKEEEEKLHRKKEKKDKEKEKKEMERKEREKKDKEKKEMEMKEKEKDREKEKEKVKEKKEKEEKLKQEKKKEEEEGKKEEDLEKKKDKSRAENEGAAPASGAAAAKSALLKSGLSPEHIRDIESVAVQMMQPAMNKLAEMFQTHNVRVQEGLGESERGSSGSGGDGNGEKMGGLSDEGTAACMGGAATKASLGPKTAGTAFQWKPPSENPFLKPLKDPLNLGLETEKKIKHEQTNSSTPPRPTIVKTQQAAKALSDSTSDATSKALPVAILTQVQRNAVEEASGGGKTAERTSSEPKANGSIGLSGKENAGTAFINKTKEKSKSKSKAKSRSPRFPASSKSKSHSYPSRKDDIKDDSDNNDNDDEWEDEGDWESGVAN